MKRIKLFEEFIDDEEKELTYIPVQPDFLDMQAKAAGMSREEWIAHYGSPEIGSGVDE